MVVRVVVVRVVCVASASASSPAVHPKPRFARSPSESESSSAAARRRRSLRGGHAARRGCRRGRGAKRRAELRVVFHQLSSHELVHLGGGRRAAGGERRAGALRAYHRSHGVAVPRGILGETRERFGDARSTKMFERGAGRGQNPRAELLGRRVLLVAVGFVVFFARLDLSGGVPRVVRLGLFLGAPRVRSGEFVLEGFFSRGVRDADDERVVVEQLADGFESVGGGGGFELARERDEVGRLPGGDVHARGRDELLGAVEEVQSVERGDAAHEGTGEGGEVRERGGEERLDVLALELLDQAGAVRQGEGARDPARLERGEGEVARALADVVVQQIREVEVEPGPGLVRVARGQTATIDGRGGVPHGERDAPQTTSAGSPRQQTPTRRSTAPREANPTRARGCRASEKRLAARVAVARRGEARAQIPRRHRVSTTTAPFPTSLETNVGTVIPRPTRTHSPARGAARSPCARGAIASVSFLAPDSPGRARLDRLGDALRDAGGASCARMLTRAVDRLLREGSDPEARRDAACTAATLSDAAWEKLHTGDWKDAESAWRDVYALAALVRVVAHPLRRLVRLLGPRPEPERIRSRAPVDVRRSSARAGRRRAPRRCRVQTRDRGGHHPRARVGVRRRARSDDASPAAGPGAGAVSEDVDEGWRIGDEDPTATVRVRLPHGSLVEAGNPNRRAVPRLASPPSLERFYRDAMSPGTPTTFPGMAEHWPARQLWSDPAYLRRAAGLRSVPVEIGEHYLHEEWRQVLMPLGTFLDEHVKPGKNPRRDAANAADGVRTGYLAQHELFDQIPALRRDVLTPDYCALVPGGDGEDGDGKDGDGDGDGDAGTGTRTHAWLGPAGTVSPLHTDPCHNLLTQVLGRKYVRLYAPSHSAAMYPRREAKQRNSSAVDPRRNPDAIDAAFPMFGKAPYVDCVLEPGDTLYVPPKWWHYVQSLTSSFSVSHWWG